MNNITISLSGNPIPVQNTADNQAIPPRPFKVISKTMASNHSVADVAGKFKSAETPRQLAGALGHEELIKLGYPQADADKSYLLATDPHSGEKTVLSLTDMLLLNTQKNKSWLDNSTAPSEKIVLLDSKGQVTGTGRPLSPETWRTIIWQVDFKGYYLQHLQQKTATAGYQQDKAFLNKAALIKTYKLAYQSGKLSDSAMQLAARAMGLPQERLGDAASWCSLTASRIKSARPDADMEIGLVAINGKASTDLLTLRDKKSGQLLLWKPGSSPPLIEFGSVQKLKEYLLRHGDCPQKMQALLSHFSRKDTRTDHPFRDFVMAYGVELALAKMRRGELDPQITAKEQYDPFGEMARRQTARLKSDADTLIVSDVDAGERSIKQRLSDINTLMMVFAPLAAVAPPLAAATNAALLASGLTQAGVGGYDIAQGNISEGLLAVADGGINIALSTIAAASEVNDLSAPPKETGEVAAPPSKADHLALPETEADSSAPPEAAKKPSPLLRPTQEQLSAKHYREIEITDADGSKSIGYVRLSNDEIKTLYRFDANSGSFRQSGQSVDAEGHIIGLAGGGRSDALSWARERWAATDIDGFSESERFHVLLMQPDRPHELTETELYRLLRQLPEGQRPQLNLVRVHNALAPLLTQRGAEVVAWVRKYWASTAANSSSATVSTATTARIERLLAQADKPEGLTCLELYNALMQLPEAEIPRISLTTIHNAFMLTNVQARAEVVDWVRKHWATTAMTSRSMTARVGGLLAHADRPERLSGSELHYALMQLPPEERPLMSLGTVKNTIVLSHVQTRPQVIAWVHNNWAATASAGSSMTVRIERLTARADKPEGLSGPELYQALMQLPPGEKPAVSLGSVQNIFALSKVEPIPEVVAWVRNNWKTTEVTDPSVRASMEALLKRTDRPEELSGQQLYLALMQLPEGERPAMSLWTVQNALAQSNVQPAPEVLAWVRNHWAATAAASPFTASRIEALLARGDRPKWISGPELYNALIELPPDQRPAVSPGTVKDAVALTNVQIRQEVMAWVANHWPSTVEAGSSVRARIGALLAREDLPQGLSSAELYKALKQLPTGKKTQMSLASVHDAFRQSNVRARSEVIAWVHNHWASTAASGRSVNLRIEFLLAQPGKPGGISGPQLHNALMRLPKGERPQVSEKTVQKILSLSYVTASQEVNEWVSNHWAATAAINLSSSARISRLLTRSDTPARISTAQLYKALMQLPEKEKPQVSLGTVQNILARTKPGIPLNFVGIEYPGTGNVMENPGPLAKRLRP